LMPAIRAASLMPTGLIAAGARTARRPRRQTKGELSGLGRGRRVRCARVPQKRRRPRGGTKRERNLVWPCGPMDTEKTQATEVGRNYSGAFKPDQKRGPKSRAPNRWLRSGAPSRTDSN
jgi:hypothetical protein